jgi:hypothetical protein
MYSTRYYLYILMKLYFLNRLSKNYRIPNFMKIRPEGAELYHADGQTDTPTLILAFHNSAKAPETSYNLRMG